MASGDENIKLPNGKTVNANGEEAKPAVQVVMRSLPRLPDPSNDSMIDRQAWSTTAPEWRQAGFGLNIEGHCKTSTCKAYNKSRVICKYGYRNKGVYDYFQNDDEVKCPMCGNYVNPANFGLYNTWYKVEGNKRPHENTPWIKVNTPWKYAGADKYTTFKDEIGDLVQWGRLVITVKETNP